MSALLIFDGHAIELGLDHRRQPLQPAKGSRSAAQDV
jgi:hypothetical protein